MARASLEALVWLDGPRADARLQGLEARRRGIRPLLGELAGAVIERRAHEALGFRSLGDFGRERIGVGARALREWARVGLALAGLPQLRRALLAGEISWTVLRKIVALATPETEEACLASVRGRTVRAVETLVRAVRAAGCGDAPAGGAEVEAAGSGVDVSVAIACPPRVLGKWEAALELARRTAGEALPVWECAEAIAAEAASALGATAEPGRRQAAPARAGARQPSDDHGLRHVAHPDLCWRALPAPDDEFAELAHGLEACDARELDGRLRAATAFLQRVDLERGRLLRQILDRHLYRELGFARFEDYVRERVDASPRSVRRLVRLARAEHRGAEPAGVANAFREGRITLLQAEALLRGNLPVAFAERVTLRRLEDELGEERVEFRAPPDVAALFVALVKRVGLEVLLEHAISTWAEAGRRFRAPPELERDGWRCTVPGCTARRNLQIHHVRFRSLGGADAPWNRTTLCAFHHLRGVHAGRVQISGRAPGVLVFELGVGRYRSGDVSVG